MTKNNKPGTKNQNAKKKIKMKTYNEILLLTNKINQLFVMDLLRLCIS